MVFSGSELLKFWIRIFSIASLDYWFRWSKKFCRHFFYNSSSPSAQTLTRPRAERFTNQPKTVIRRSRETWMKYCYCIPGIFCIGTPVQLSLLGFVFFLAEIDNFWVRLLTFVTQKSGQKFQCQSIRLYLASTQTLYQRRLMAFNKHNMWYHSRKRYLQSHNGSKLSSMCARGFGVCLQV